MVRDREKLWLLLLAQDGQQAKPARQHRLPRARQLYTHKRGNAAQVKFKRARTAQAVEQERETHGEDLREGEKDMAFGE
jgi:hypothetical protein